MKGQALSPPPCGHPGGESADATIAHFTAGAIAEVRDGKLAYDAFYLDQIAILGQHGQPWVDGIRTSYWGGVPPTLI